MPAISTQKAFDFATRYWGKGAAKQRVAVAVSIAGEAHGSELGGVDGFATSLNGMLEYAAAGLDAELEYKPIAGDDSAIVIRVYFGERAEDWYFVRVAQ